MESLEAFTEHRVPFSTNWMFKGIRCDPCLRLTSAKRIWRGTIRLAPLSRNFPHADTDGENKSKQWHCVFPFSCPFSSWNSSPMISNQCCAHAQRQIIRTQCFLSQSKQMTGTVSIRNLMTELSLLSAAAAAEHVLPADMRQWVITNC